MDTKIKYSVSLQVITLEGVMREFRLSMDGYLSPKTVRWYDARLKSLTKYFGPDRQIDTITLRDLCLWRADLAGRKFRYTSPTSVRPAIQGGYSPHTLYTFYRAVKTFFRWAAARQFVDENPAAQLRMMKPPSRKPRGIPRDRVFQMIDVADSLRDKSLLMFLADTGCRVGGAAGLTLDDLYLEERRALVREKGRGGLKERIVRFLPATRDMLRRYIEEERPETPCRSVWIGKSHGHPRNGKLSGLTETGIYQVNKRLAGLIHLERGFNPHNFRHAQIRGSLDAGMPFPEVSQEAGHSSATVTADIYGTVGDIKLARDHDRYSWMRDYKP